LGKKMKSRLVMLREWRRIVLEAAKAIKKVYPNAEIYVVGGAAENRLTIRSDIDLLVVLKEIEEEKASILARIWEALEEKIPVYYPLELHVISSSELHAIKGRKIRVM